MSVFDENGATALEPEHGICNANQQQGLADAPLESVSVTADPPRMVIIEDAPLIALDLAEAMRELGFDVRATAFTHEQALAEIQQAQPHFAIIDLHLGPGESGVRQGEALLDLLDGIGCRCLIFSGDAAACRRVAGHYPHFPVLLKPARPEMLVAAVQKLRTQKLA